jgi:hypothetical protein
MHTFDFASSFTIPLPQSSPAQPRCTPRRCKGKDHLQNPSLCSNGAGTHVTLQVHSFDPGWDTIVCQVCVSQRRGRHANPAVY